MKTLILLTLLSAQASELIDLGTITPRRAIVLERNTDRPDWSHFKAEFLSLAPSSNQVTLILTNDLLTLSNLVGLPSGPAVVGLRSVTSDGTESPTVLFKLDIRRAEPPAPGARAIKLEGQTNASETLHRAMERHRKSREIAPPAVPGSTNKPEATFELPRSKSETYGQHLDQIADLKRRR